jgi:hypothetical protein
MKTRNDFRSEFNKETQLHVLVTDGTGFIHYSDDYVHWLEDIVMKQTNTKITKAFKISYRFTDRTDASLHEELIIASSSEEALNILYINHKYHIEWHTINEVPS